jgi:hypothetical protein
MIAWSAMTSKKGLSQLFAKDFSREVKPSTCRFSPIQSDMSTPDVNAIVAAFKRVTSADSTSDSEFVVPYSPAPANTNQFVFFLKPEATTANTEYILNLSLGVLAKAGVKFGM